MNFRALLRKEIVKGQGYTAEPVFAGIKLDANELPYDVTKEHDMVAEAIRTLPFNRYPDPAATELREAIGKKLGVNPDMIMLGNGSDELIQILLIALGAGRPRALVPIPGFAMYEVLPPFLGYELIRVPLDKEFDLNLTRILKLSYQARPKIIFIGYPNNPTGRCFSQDRIIKILEDFPGLVLIDEAYFDFSGKSFISYLGHYPRLVIARTLSKIGLAGLRVGILLGHTDLIRELTKVKLPYNVSIFSQHMARIAMGKKILFEDKINEVIRERERLWTELSALPRVHPFPSDANFILFRVKEKAQVVHRLLYEKGISVRNLAGLPGLKGCLRVTVGRPAENRAFLQGLKQAVNKAGKVEG